jgi:hypothetical protein
MIKHGYFVSTVSILALALAACGGESGTPGSGSGSPSGKPSASSAVSGKPSAAAATATATAMPAATAQPAEGKVTEYDLTKAGDKWKGYVAKLPREGAQVMADGSDGARLATNGREENPFDIAWAPGKGHFADLKKGIEAAGKTAKIKTTFLADTADGVEYTNEFEGGSKTYHFDIVVKVGKADFHCYTLPLGLSDEAQFKKHKDACKTLEKK